MLEYHYYTKGNDESEGQALLLPEASGEVTLVLRCEVQESARGDWGWLSVPGRAAACAEASGNEGTWTGRVPRARVAAVTGYGIV